MNLDAETKSLLQKRLRQNHTPLEIGGCAFLSTLTFTVVYCCRALGFRQTKAAVASVGVLVFFGAACLTAASTFVKYRAKAPSRTWLVATVSLWAGFMLGFVLGDNIWHEQTVQYFTLKEMASYVNINPSVDKAQSFMDAGILYFGAGTHIDRSKALAFRNGATYCVAPIYSESQAVSTAAEPASGASTKTAAGFVIPRSGSVDFWAVGRDCCGPTGNKFTCGEASSRSARSGLRVLDDRSTVMYQLAVQEWSATTGVPVKHPMFLHWVSDPLLSEEDYLIAAKNTVAIHVTLYFFGSLFGSYFLYMALRHWKFV